MNVQHAAIDRSLVSGLVKRWFCRGRCFHHGKRRVVRLLPRLIGGFCEHVADNDHQNLSLWIVQLVHFLGLPNNYEYSMRILSVKTLLICTLRVHSETPVLWQPSSSTSNGCRQTLMSWGQPWHYLTSPKPHDSFRSSGKALSLLKSDEGRSIRSRLACTMSLPHDALRTELELFIRQRGRGPVAEV